MGLSIGSIRTLREILMFVGLHCCVNKIYLRIHPGSLKTISRKYNIVVMLLTLPAAQLLILSTFELIHYLLFQSILCGFTTHEYWIPGPQWKVVRGSSTPEGKPNHNIMNVIVTVMFLIICYPERKGASRAPM